MDPASNSPSYPMPLNSHVVGFYELERSELAAINLPRGSKGKKLALELHRKLLQRQDHGIVTLGTPNGKLEVVEVIKDDNNHITRRVLVFRSAGPNILFANLGGSKSTWPTHFLMYGPFLSLPKACVDILYRIWCSLSAEELQSLEKLTFTSLHAPFEMFAQAGAQYSSKRAGLENCFDRFPAELQKIICAVWEAYKD